MPRAASTRSTRDRMLDAALTVMRERGVARATTKEIAREAGFSEAALYKHFEDKTALFVAVLVERVPSRFTDVLHGLPARVGTGQVEEILVEVASEAIAFYRETFPMGAALFSEPAILAAHRAALARLGTGPHVAVDGLADYLAAEAAAGRVDAALDPRASALLLLGACQMTTFLAAFGATDEAATGADLARAAVRGLLPR
ncbi:helix-turn-helix domain containing protein [Actinomycetospora lutea]|uniref:TetR/AcrR family transcriptional regulator n=1 Tax=Actinomycetospora lutea TaxID=663604 RepID=UPI002365B56D|nr:TetR/AcrR family transcriptional regulator [Actinomycetospora lutea]MDD7941795.1 helix-turn-helix domain containing protein [Actinomycetospora lutea]